MLFIAPYHLSLRWVRYESYTHICTLHCAVPLFDKSSVFIIELSALLPNNVTVSNREKFKFQHLPQVKVTPINFVTIIVIIVTIIVTVIVTFTGDNYWYLCQYDSNFFISFSSQLQSDVQISFSIHSIYICSFLT